MASTAKAEDPACVQCISGTIHKGQPIGAVEKIHGLDTYVVGNRTSPRGIIVMYSDVFGLQLPNNKIICDAYAKSGEWLVYMPDFFQGDPMPLKIADLLIPTDTKSVSTFGLYTGLLGSAPSLVMWMARHKEPPTTKTCMDFLEALRRATPKTQKIGIVGFCWGGRYSIRAGQESRMIELDGAKVPLVDAAVALHPSNLTPQQDAEGLIIPVSIGWGQEDTNTKIQTKGLVEEVQNKDKAAGKTITEIDHRIYKPGRHGFAVRGNPDDPLERACLENSEKHVLEWFGKYL